MDMSTWNILLVDDEVEFISTLAERLEIRGIAARVVYDGEAALKAVAENEPQVMVLDVMMPGIKGLDVLQRVKEEHPRVQVILLTGHANMEVALEGMTQGAFDYLLKPVAINDLIFKIQDAAKKSGKTT